jgi:hypothetical protein
MLKAFGKTLARSRFAGAPGLVALYGPDGLAVYHILAVLLQTCSFIFVSPRLSA